MAAHKDFYDPFQIPGNTGCIARSCAASGVGLHLVEVATGSSVVLSFTHFNKFISSHINRRHESIVLKIS